MNWSNDNCPVCDEAAKEALPRIDDLIEFICDNCNRYRITGSAMATFRYKDRATRQSILETAKRRVAGSEDIPTITSSM